MSKIWAHLFIEGRVQGVFFRSYTQEEAQKRGLTGWVKNLYDGRVEAVFEGEEKDIQSMIKWCHSGPPHAVVADVSVEIEEYRGEYSSFSVKF
ncbi:MAG: acylphosphatase [Deltaproteobacteria bacterium DG_8]|nr:MAG: acylphosphatase [Deltaproteobacteria bacterium DG_8]